MSDKSNEAIYQEIQRLMGDRTGELSMEVSRDGLEVWKIAFGFTFAALAVVEAIEDPVDRASVAEAVSNSFTFQCRALADDALAHAKAPPLAKQH